MKQINDVVLRTATKAAVVIILTFSVSLFISYTTVPVGGLLAGWPLLQLLSCFFLFMILKVLKKTSL